VVANCFQPLRNGARHPPSMFSATEMHEGEIKYFAGQKGYGFIICPDFEADVYFQRLALPEELQLSENNLKGLSCTFETFVTQEGKTQARNLQVSASGVEGSKVIGTIKSYVAKSQYGFITSPVLETDIYFKAKDLTESWLQDQNLKDCKVIFEVITMKDGKLQARGISVLQGTGQIQPIQGMPQNQMGLPPMAAPAPIGAGGHMTPVPPRRATSPVLAPPVMAPPAQGNLGGFVPPPPQPTPNHAPTPAANGPVMGHMLGDGSQMIGKIKTFDLNKGFGFIVAPNFPSDVYFKASDPTIQIGVEVTFTLKYTQDGRPQAQNVCTPLQDGEMLVGTVRSYNPNKGFGFLFMDGRSQDIYFPKSTLPIDLQEETNLEGSQFQFNVNASGNKPQAQELQLVTSAPIKRPAPPQSPGTGSGVPPAKRLRSPGAPVVAPSGQNLQPGSKGMSGTLVPGKGPGGKGPGMAMPMPGGKGMPGMPNKGNGCRGMNQMQGPGMQSMNAMPMVGGNMGMQQGPSMAQQAAMAMAANAPVRPAPSLSPGAEARHRGSVKSFNPQKGFGFITCPSLQSDVYFNSRNLADHMRTAQLDHRQVSFTVRHLPDGKLQANNIQVEG